MRSGTILNRAAWIGWIVLWGAADAAAQGQLDWQPLPEALACAEQEDLPLLVYVHADWCAPCRRMEREVFPMVSPLLARFARAGITIDDHDSTLPWAGADVTPAIWSRRLHIRTTPTFAFLSPGGTLLARATGYFEPARFALLLAYVDTKAYRHADFPSYEQQTPRPRLDVASTIVAVSVCDERTTPNR